MTEVLVSGCGPAGAVTALALAARGLEVTVVDPLRPDGGDHDIVLTGPALRALDTLPGWNRSLVRPLDELEVWFGSGPAETYDGLDGGVCERAALVSTLRDLLDDAGVRLVSGEVAAVHAGGAVLADDGTVEADHVVVASGGGGPLTPEPAPHATGAVRARRYRGDSGPRMQLWFPAPENNPRARPTPLWILPGTDGTCTIAAARLGGAPPDLSELLSVMGLGTLRPVGPETIGAVNGAFTPDRAVHHGALLVGDAAGLVNPFTGEGLSYAIQSGLLAAEAIGAHPAEPEEARGVYRHALARAFVGYFESARHASRRYHLAWRILAATSDSAHPFYAKGRRATLLPSGLAGLAAEDELALPGGEELVLLPVLAACDEVLLATVRNEWPFLARLAITGATRRTLRPATLFFAAMAAEGAAPRIEYAPVGAAIELATLGALAFLGPPAAPVRSRGVDWAAATTVLAGDFLLAQASKLVAESAPAVSWAFSEWLGELTRLRALRLDPARPAEAAEVFAALLEFPARIGATLGDAGPATVDAVRTFGAECGRALLHAEDILALRGERTRLDITLPALLEGRVSALPDLLAEPGLTVADLDADRRSVALSVSARACRNARDRAWQAVADVPSPLAAGILHQFAATVARPSERPRSDAITPG